MVPDELFDLIAFPDDSDVASVERQQAIEKSFSSIWLCDNCGRLLRETEDGVVASYVAETTPPRVWADFSDRDALGRVQLRHPRSVADINRQRLLLHPPLRLVLYGESGDECAGEANFGLDASGNPDESLWAVTLD
ncbi:hypothetical protein [Streptomyces sp. NPDC020917]|uniref:hypothetical protein n=1 Tax=Streptomyces sp. NPDC020917 TaxID=3365102 RepID=UPI0037BC4918